MNAIVRRDFDAASLVAQHPPKWRSRNKRALYGLLTQSGTAFEGAISYARWREEQLPERVPSGSAFTTRPGVFTYDEPDGTGIHWYMNFADPRLFVAYSSDLLAQDELQVMEHPALGSLAEALNGPGQDLATMDLSGSPTPITITGVQRRLAIDTQPNAAAGRPGGLYGNAFARASVDTVVAATTVLEPPTVSNILAIAAPSYGTGRYTSEQIDYVLTAAYTGYQAARTESARVGAAPERTVIHTGWWGCGAFGGNRTLMTVLQALAADMADLDIIFHAFDDAGVALAKEAYELYASIRQDAPSVLRIVSQIRQQGFEWGVSDGN